VSEQHDSGGRPDLDRLLEDLRGEVERRRRAGSYPPGLEDELDHLGRILGRDPLPGYDRVRRQLEVVRRLPPLGVERIPPSSRIPGGALAHRVLARLTARQTTGVLQQVQQRFDALVDLLVAMIESAGGAETHVHADLVGLIDAMLDRLASYERAGGEGGPAGVELGRRVAALEVAEARRQAPPWPGPSPPLVSRAELEHHLGGRRPVLELRPPEGGGDPLAELAAAGDGSLGAVLARRVFESLAPRQVYELVLVAFDKLRPGGRLVVEGANPRSLAGLIEGSRGIPGRDQLVDPGYLRWLLDAVGFAETGVESDGIASSADPQRPSDQQRPTEQQSPADQRGPGERPEPRPVYVVWASR
jgi:hypothetical protein